MEKTVLNSKEQKIKNIERPFTELFSLLKRYETLPNDSPTLAYTSKEMNEIRQHADNAIDSLLSGLHGVAHIIKTATSEQKNHDELNQLGILISIISNLTEALNDLKADTDYVLTKRGVANY
ncbi:MAG: hypothetical protein JO149_02280 [Gammaproteobacteria bacterium]|nr:hypothetical protein [Gammaproteobacteria bacterium]